MSKEDTKGMNLACCPFCSHKGLKVNPHRVSKYDWKAPRRYRVHCNRCHCNGPLGKTEEEAIEKWNVPLFMMVEGD